MTALNSFDRLSQPVRDYLTQRAANYDYYTARDLYADIPSELYGNEPAIMSFLQGNEALGVEPREVMHLVSEHNGGLDLPENLELGPKSLNRSIGADNVSPADMEAIDASNAEAVEVLLEAEPSVLLEAMGDMFEATATVTSVAAAAEPEVVSQWVERGRGAHMEEILLDSSDSVTEVTATAVEASEAGLAELVGEAVLEGAVPALFAYKAATAVADQCETDEDKLGYGALAAGGTVLLYANPITGPFAWGATAIYSGFKLIELGVKVADHCYDKSSQGAATPETKAQWRARLDSAGL